jgi:hypothetical protein
VERNHEKTYDSGDPPGGLGGGVFGVGQPQPPFPLPFARSAGQDDPRRPRGIPVLRQDTLFYIAPKIKDVVYTPDKIAIDIISWCHPTGVCLDPCRGDGAFFRNFPNERDWCELVEGRNFFDYTRRIDWIIGNPPYSIFDEWLTHSMEISNNIVYILPTNKVFQRIKIMELIQSFGGIFGIRIYGSGKNIGFPFGFSVGAFHFKRNYTGDTRITFKNNKS